MNCFDDNFYPTNSCVMVNGEVKVLRKVRDRADADGWAKPQDSSKSVMFLSCSHLHVSKPLRSVPDHAILSSSWSV